jgi:hypothetical protein
MQQAEQDYVAHYHRFDNGQLHCSYTITDSVQLRAMVWALAKDGRKVIIEAREKA